MEKWKNIWNKIVTKEVISYLIFGILTTLVNFIMFLLLARMVSLEENLSNIIAIITSILFAYFTNRSYVFQSKRDTFKETLLEFFKFILGRAFTMLFEIVGFFILFNLLNIPDIISKLFVTFIVIVLNYFISKFFAFKK